MAPRLHIMILSTALVVLLVAGVSFAQILELDGRYWLPTSRPLTDPGIRLKVAPRTELLSAVARAKREGACRRSRGSRKAGGRPPGESRDPRHPWSSAATPGEAPADEIGKLAW